MSPIAIAASTTSQRDSCLSSADEAMLCALWRYHLLTSAQMLRLHYSSGSLSYVQVKLKRLTDLGYAQRLFLPRPSQHGSGPSIYCLARRGLRFLASAGFAVTNRYRPSDKRAYSYMHLSHALAVNDVLIAADLCCRRFPHLRLETMLHDYALKRAPMTVTDGGGKTAVVPDAWLDVRVGRDQLCQWLELDRGTVEAKAWRAKVRALALSTKSAYQEHFQTSSLTVLVLTTAGERRLRELLRWTEAEVAAVGRQYADLFRFAAFDPATIDPATLFFEALWQQPGAAHPVALIE